MTGFLRCCWFYVSTDSVCFSRFVICCPCFCLGRFAISHALRYRVLAICCQPRRSPTSGSRNHRAALYCQRSDSVAAAFCVSARLALVFQRGYLLCPGVIYNLPERRAQQLRWIIQWNGVAVAVLARGEPSAELPAARVRRTVADSASSCCGLQISVNLQSCPVRPSIAFSGVRLIRAHAVTGCPVGLEIH